MNSPMPLEYTTTPSGLALTVTANLLITEDKIDTSDVIVALIETTLALLGTTKAQDPLGIIQELAFDLNKSTLSKN